jgi:CheY-like chemotaxis protein
MLCVAFRPACVAGAQACARVVAQDRDRVRMGCQFPVLDGYQAASEIRRLPRGRGLTLPIVTLTANVLHGDPPRCVDAGMSGFLAQPRAPASLGASRVGGPAHAATIHALRGLDEPLRLGLVEWGVASLRASAEATLARMACALGEGSAKALGPAAHFQKSSAPARAATPWRGAAATSRRAPATAARTMPGTRSSRSGKNNNGRRRDGVRC